MRIDPVEAKPDPFEELTPLQKKIRKTALFVSFVGVYFWVVKILFL
jgi:hypothetical protein